MNTFSTHFFNCLFMSFAFTHSFTNSEAQVSFLALGDSYTIGESVSEEDRWPNQLARALNVKGIKCQNPTIIATTGWRTDDLAHAIRQADLTSDFQLVSLLIGVNNQYQGKSVEQYEKEFRELLATAIKLAGGRSQRVFVVSIPDYGFTPFGKPKQTIITDELNKFNEVNKRISQSEGVAWYHITDISREGLKDPELVASDGLHPSGKMYGLWVQRMLEGVCSQLK
jgi:lysophospholipase L1-like esterase